MATLEKAIALAAQYHEGQKDKAGEPFRHTYANLLITKQIRR